MGDAELANINRTLKSVDNTLKELVRVMTAINENMVTVGRTVNNWFQSIEDVSVQVVPPKQHKENPMPDQPSEKDQNDAVDSRIIARLRSFEHSQQSHHRCNPLDPR